MSSLSWLECGAPACGIALSRVIRFVAAVCTAMAQECAGVRERNWTVPARERATGNDYQKTTWTHCGVLPEWKASQ
ncbi:hypothetical protein BJY52DRAFT_804721 [Lactarius psammicola]|nr:hypothetical protein BJY52DRAFT_804721 [Lactarius psammicola]